MCIRARGVSCGGQTFFKSRMVYVVDGMIYFCILFDVRVRCETSDSLPTGDRNRLTTLDCTPLSILHECLTLVVTMEQRSLKYG